MWDEKKFFEDYVEESEKIKPDDHFVEQMKKMAAREEQKKNTIPMMKYAAIAASFVVCIGLGCIVWNIQNASSDDMASDYDKSFTAEEQTNGSDSQTASEETGDATSDSTGMWQNEAGNEPDGLEAESDSMEIRPDTEPIKAAVDSMKQGAVVRDEAGNEISLSQQEELSELLENAVEAEAPEGIAKEASYFLEGEQAIEIQVWENGFLWIDGKWYLKNF